MWWFGTGCISKSKITELIKLVTDSEDYDDDFVKVRLEVIVHERNEKQVEERKLKTDKEEKEREERKLEAEREERKLKAEREEKKLEWNERKRKSEKQ